MQQTFNDLCNERRRQTKQELLAVVLWMFADTSIAIARERVLLITEGNAMKNVLANLKSPAIIGFVLVLPFAILEFMFNTVNRQNAPGLVVLFGLLWLLPTAFIAILLPTVRRVQAGNSVKANPLDILLRVPFLAVIAIIWGVILVDQIPCFAGVPNCD